jgi:hypothetical protein
MQNDNLKIKLQSTMIYKNKRVNSASSIVKRLQSLVFFE